MPDTNTLAIILGGGRGTRLFPLTKMRAKPAVPLAGRYRLIDIPISNCINSGVSRIFVLTQFLSASLHRHVYETYKFDIFSRGFVEILPAEQTLTHNDWYQGTADAVHRQLPRILSRDPDNVLILAGDHLYRTDYREFLRLHEEVGADVTIGVLPVAAADTGRFGILQTDADGHITRFAEKPTDPALLAELASAPNDPLPFLGSMGIYVFRTSVLKDLLEQGEGDDFGKHIIPAAIQRLHVHAWRFDGFWEDIGTIASFYDANMLLTRRERPFSFYDRRYPIYTRPRFLPGSQIDGSSMNDVLLGDGCRVNQSLLEGCVIGQRSIIHPGCHLRGVIMLGADHYETPQELAQDKAGWLPAIGIGKDCAIERAILDKGARIGAGVRIESHEGQPDSDGPEERWYVRDGIVVIPKNTVIEDATVIAPARPAAAGV
ncbi:MAG: glucose-1-phosphate adenylyltransferase [Pseudomonadota bacterium]